MRVELTKPRAHACDVRLRDGEQLMIGRAQSCEISIPCKSVSKRHACITRDGDQVVVEDLGSRNGIYVNGITVSSAYLEPGDLLQVGRAVLCLKGKNLASSEIETGFRLVEDELELTPRLVLVEDASSSWDLTESSTIGCRPENAICISALGVSRFHAEVVQRGDSWVIQDLGATNGVEVNGEKVDSAVLEPGDEILIGETRMRFELPGSGSPRRRQLRSVLAGAVALLLCATGVSAATQPTLEEEAVAVADTEQLEAGIRELLAERYAAAQEALRLGEVQTEGEARRASRTLRKLAREFERLELDPDGFLWERGQEVAASASKLDLDAELADWLDEKREFLAANRVAAETLNRALNTTEASQGEADFDVALDGFMDAAVSCEGISPTALCYARSQTVADAAREHAVARVDADLKQLESQAPPSWGRMQDVARRGLEFAQSGQLRLALRQTIGRAQREQAAAATLGRAQESIASGRVDAGLRELERIAGTSYYAPQKQVLLQRIELKGLLRRAKELYARAAGQQARDVLDEAFDLDRLPMQEVQREVGALRQAWVAVEREFARAQRATKSGEQVLARDGFREVLRLEPDPSNRFHRQAVEQLAYIQARIRDEIESDLRSLDHQLELPLDDLGSADLALASRLIRKVEGNEAATDAQKARTISAVQVLATRVNARKRVKDALFTNDLESLELLGAQLSFVDLWLPSDAPERDGLKTAKDRLEQRLARRASTRRLTRASK